ncbi:putative G-protein coupled receptor Mth-like 2 [Papilio xuthus]|uniref:Putative G-protein coupled receptor Mth-like 2 n=1 Tax=Papilio xuthus TaxID=66420 RepID=A0A194PRV6_PAPXU|nr:putative G-protein coupled receptor Mth-like 2 [Papilio xuthus]
MRRILFLILLYVCELNGQPCEDKNSIDISDGVLRDGTIFKNGLAFPPKYVYKKNFNGVNETRGCVCELRNCFRKCCPMGSVMYRKNCTQMREQDILMNDGLDIFFMNALQRRMKFDKSDDLFLVYGRPCEDVFLENDGPWFVQKCKNSPGFLRCRRCHSYGRHLRDDAPSRHISVVGLRGSGCAAGNYTSAAEAQHRRHPGST